VHDLEVPASVVPGEALGADLLRELVGDLSEPAARSRVIDQVRKARRLLPLRRTSVCLAGHR
jgi:hypothetical protein